MVSIIIPNYNHEIFLKQRIESILNQTYQNYEIILLDDRSSDKSKDIIEEYRNHPKVSQIIYNSKNSGSTFKQWHQGILLAKGEYIWIAESDDISNSNFLLRATKILDKNPDIGLVYTQSIVINEKGENIGNMLSHTLKFQTSLWNSDFQFNGVEFVKNYMFFQNSIPNASAVLFKKRDYNYVGGVNQSFKINGDWDFYIRILTMNDIYYIKEEFNQFRSHSENGSSRNIINGNNIKEYYILAKKWKRKFHFSSNEIEKLNEHIYNCWILQNGNKIRRLLSSNLFKIFPYAISQDNKVLWRLLKSLINK